MLKQETQTIDGLSFTTTQFPAMRAFTLFSKLVKTIGPAITVLSGANPESDVAELAPSIATALKDVDPDAMTILAAEVLSSTSAVMTGPSGAAQVPLNSVDGINLVFMGRLMTMFKVLAFAVKVNYGDFFGGSASAAPLPQTPSA